MVHRVTRRGVLKGLAGLVAGAGLSGFSLLESACLGYTYTLGDMTILGLPQEIINESNDFIFCDPFKRSARDVRTSFSTLSYESPHSPAPESTVPAKTIDALFHNSVVFLDAFIPVMPPGVFDQAINQGLPEDRREYFHLSVAGDSIANGVMLTRGGHILTAYHVVENEFFHDYRPILVMNEHQQISEAHVVAYSKKHDLALLKAGRDGFATDAVPITFAEIDRLEGGSALINMGRTFVGGAAFEFTNEKGLVISVDSSFSIERFTSSGQLMGKPPFYISSRDGIIFPFPLGASGFSRGGYSGSMIVTPQGYIAGIISRGSQGATVSSSSSAIKKLLTFYQEEVGKREMRGRE